MTDGVPPRVTAAALLSRAVHYRYFPEVAELLKQALPGKCVVDGEIVVVTDEGLDFDTLQNRLHPAASRVNKLAAETPASFVAFDLLALGDKDLTGEPFAERRRL